MTVTTDRAVTLDELRDLFTGVPLDNGGWSTSPCYAIALAEEIARRCDADSEHKLRQILFDDTPVDQVPNRALMVIQLAVQHYRNARKHQARELP